MNIFNFGCNNIKIPEGNALKVLAPDGSALWKKPLVILPPEYLQVEYIQMTGTQYTQYSQPYADVSELQFEFSLDDLLYYMRFTGAYNSNMEAYLSTVFQVGTDTLCCFSLENNNGCIFSNKLTTNTKYKLTIQADAVTSIQTAVLTQQEANITETKTSQMNPVTTKSLSNFGIGLNGYVITDNNGPYFNDRLIGKIYSYKHLANGTVVRNFVPCYRKSDSVPGFFEIVHGEFYPSETTEPFIAGPNVLTNIIDYFGYFDDTRWSWSMEKPLYAEGHVMTGLIDTSRFLKPLVLITKGVDFMNSAANYLVACRDDGSILSVTGLQTFLEGGDHYNQTWCGVTVTLDVEGNFIMNFGSNAARYFRAVGMGKGSDLIITANRGIPNNLAETATTDPDGSEIYNRIGHVDGLRWSSSGGGITDDQGGLARLTGWMPYSIGTLTIKNIGLNRKGYVHGAYIVYYHNTGDTSVFTTGIQDTDEFSIALNDDTITHFRVSGYYVNEDGSIIPDPIITIT